MKFVLGLFFIFITNVSFSHEYFFAFAEMEYNDISSKFEITISVTTHDLEKVYEKNNDVKLDLQEYKSNSETAELMITYFKQHFELKTEKATCKLNLIGFESNLNGTTNFYFESDEIDITPKLSIKNDILMDEYPNQQNKITLYYQSKSYTYDFLSHERIKTIILE